MSWVVIISIHAPTRGATDGNLQCQLINAISIHAPTRGATYLRLVLSLHLMYFNPRSHERSDNIVGNMTMPVQISIHAPTRGATSATEDDIAAFAISIHAPTRGATHRCLFYVSNALFQSTLPREERRSILFIPLFPFKYFNPRSHERSDFIKIPPFSGFFRFQSTLPREERPRFAASSPPWSKFQSTLPREERQQYCTKNLFIFIQYRQ